MPVTALTTGGLLDFSLHAAMDNQVKPYSANIAPFSNFRILHHARLGPNFFSHHGRLHFTPRGRRCKHKLARVMRGTNITFNMGPRWSDLSAIRTAVRIGGVNHS